MSILGVAPSGRQMMVSFTVIQGFERPHSTSDGRGEPNGQTTGPTADGVRLATAVGVLKMMELAGSPSVDSSSPRQAPALSTTAMAATPVSIQLASPRSKANHPSLLTITPCPSTASPMRQRPSCALANSRSISRAWFGEAAMSRPPDV